MKIKRVIICLTSSLLVSVSLSAIPLSQVKPTLWPKATYNPSLMVAGAVQKAHAAWSSFGRASDGRNDDGNILDIGALKEVAGETQILIPSGWTLYIDREHRGTANYYSRVGPGWSFGNNSIHNSGRGWFFALCGRKPDPLEACDMQYSGVLFETLKRGANEGVGTVRGITEKERETICAGNVSLPSPIVITPPPLPPPIDKPVDKPICPPVLPCPACPNQSTVICPVLSRLVKEFSCTN